MRSRAVQALALVAPLMTWPVGCGHSAASKPHEQVQIRYLQGPTRHCLKGTANWPTGDLPPLPATLDDSDALYTARLLDELDAYRKWGNYVVAWCVKSAPVETPLRSFRPAPTPATRTVKLLTVGGAILPVAIPATVVP